MLVSRGSGQPGPFLSPATLALRGYSIAPGILGNAKRGLRLLDVICKEEIMPTRSGCWEVHRWFQNESWHIVGAQ